ncbi:MAG: pantetheine-phosphate adenylyltransferase [Acholeplasmatales bacterium]|nr:pantetheine-phosphate adenylyltransferase [Acholeplasmatales bacterium]
MRKAVYPGSFDPISNGHLDLIKRASKLFDEVHVLISYNVTKKYTFTQEERIQMVKDSVANLGNVIVTSSDDLVVKYCKENNINIIIRGLRNYSDYENEFSLFQYNRDIYPNVETVLLMPTTKNQVVSSSAIKELVSFGCDISKYVPSVIKNRVIEKYNQK